MWSQPFPHAGFLGEETGVARAATGLQFIVDPIDGTRAFVRGWSTWSVLVGIEAEDVPVVGIAYMPAAGDFFVGVQGKGATHNGKPVRVSRSAACRRDRHPRRAAAVHETGSAIRSPLVGACDSARGFPDFDGYRQVLARTLRRDGRSGRSTL